jgi:PPM family protein phosphatase
MQFLADAATDIGRKRAQNQDNLATHPDIGLFMVADGMGGHRGGETASAMAVQIVPQEVRKLLEAPGADPRQILTQAIQAANRGIYERAYNEPQLQGMGTTCTVLLFKGNLLTIGHVGDSRCYFIRPDTIWQATRDHSLVQEKLRAGLITREEVKTDRMKNVITRSVGFEPEVNVEIYEMSVRKGDTFLLCSDGLSGMIEDSEILSVMQEHWFTYRDPHDAVAGLISAANDHGGEDNVTAIAVEVQNP